MKKITAKIAAVISSAAVLLFAATPVLASASTNLLETGNGAGSENTVDVNSTQSHVVDQTNNFKGTTTVNASPNSGDNSVANQTGGSTVIGTGNASASVDILTQANLNQLQDNRMSSDQNKTLDISGNGAFSSNDINAKNNTTDSVFQNNKAFVDNTVNTNPNSGRNDITNGTGGSESIITGHAASSVGIDTKANANIADLGGDSHSSSNGSTALISGNGAASSNAIDLTQDRMKTFVQNNDTVLKTSVHASPNSGDNFVTNSTQGPSFVATSKGILPLSSDGGGIRIDTGNAISAVDVANRGGLNIASDGSGSNSSTTVATSGNGAFSSNGIFSNLNDGLSLFQGSGADNSGRFVANTDINANPLSGINRAKDNTFSSGDTSLLVTGHALSDTRVTNQGNANIFGSGNDLTLPGGTTLGFNFDLGGLFGMVH